MQFKSSQNFSCDVVFILIKDHRQKWNRYAVPQELLNKQISKIELPISIGYLSNTCSKTFTYIVY